MEGQPEGQTMIDTPRVAVVSEALRCDICGATATKHGNPFTKPQQVSMHKARAHAGMGPGNRNGSKKKFACPVEECEKSYGRYTSLTHHLREDHHRSITEFPELLKTRAPRGGKHYSKKERANLANKASAAAAPPIRIVREYNDTPRLSQFLREREAVEQALAYVQTIK